MGRAAPLRIPIHGLGSPQRGCARALPLPREELGKSAREASLAFPIFILFSEHVDMAGAVGRVQDGPSV